MFSLLLLHPTEFPPQKPSDGSYSPQNKLQIRCLRVFTLDAHSCFKWPVGLWRNYLPTLICCILPSLCCRRNSSSCCTLHTYVLWWSKWTQNPTHATVTKCIPWCKVSLSLVRGENIFPNFPKGTIRTRTSPDFFSNTCIVLSLLVIQVQIS